MASPPSVFGYPVVDADAVFDFPAPFPAAAPVLVPVGAPVAAIVAADDATMLLVQELVWQSAPLLRFQSEEGKRK